MKLSFTVHSIFIFGLALLTSFKTADPIVLIDEPLSFTPQNYYISNVVDDRIDKGPMAQLIINLPGNKTNTQSVDIQGSVPEALNRFIAHNLQKDRSLNPVTVGIKEFKLTENILPNGGIDGKV